MTILRKTSVALTSDAAPFAIRAERASDTVAREALLDACFGANRRQGKAFGGRAFVAQALAGARMAI